MLSDAQKQQSSKDAREGERIDSTRLTASSQNAATPQQQNTTGDPKHPYLTALANCISANGPADWILVIVGALGIIYGLQTLDALIEQTEAQKRSTDIQATQFRMAYDPVVEVVVLGSDSMNRNPHMRERIHLQVFIGIKNVGTTAIRIDAVHAEHSLAKQFNSEESVGQTIGPGAIYRLRITDQLTVEDTVQWFGKKLIFRLQLVIEFRHPITGKVVQTHTGMVLCGKDAEHEWIEPTDHEGYPKNDGPSTTNGSI